MARLLLELALLVLTHQAFVSAESSIFSRFMTFINDFNRPYKNGTDEFLHRFEIFKSNLQQVERLNKLHDDGPAVYGVTKFSDLSQEEFKAQYLSDLQYKRLPASTVLRFQSERMTGGTGTVSASTLPQKVDWRQSGAVSAIKNQGHCGACWAFSAAEAVESAYAIANNCTAPDLAVQQLIDCSKKNRGCEGGDICEALNYIRLNGMTYEAAYPLTDKDGTCHAVGPSHGTVHIASYGCNNFIGKEQQILNLLATQGPVAVAVDATTWNNYVQGVIQFHCETNINHAVDIVGYDLTGPVPYYIVRNSWGTDFGIDGFMYIKIGGNLCGIAAEVADVTMV